MRVAVKPVYVRVHASVCACVYVCVWWRGTRDREMQGSASAGGSVVIYTSSSSEIWNNDR